MAKHVGSFAPREAKRHARKLKTSPPGHRVEERGLRFLEIDRSISGSIRVSRLLLQAVSR